MSKGINVITIKTCGGTEIDVTQFSDGKLLLEKNLGERWFVSTQFDDCFYLQENLENGEIIDMGFKDNLPDALRAIAWAGI